MIEKWRLLKPSVGADNCWHVTDENDTFVARVFGFANSVDEESRKKAQLIAAAPELLSALEDITAGLNEAEDTMPLIRAEEVRNARKAIAKAKGEL